MGAFSISHLIILLIIIILVFGTSKLKSIGSDLGTAIKSFRKGLNESSKDKDDKTDTTQR